MAIPRNLGNLASGADSNGVLGVTKGGTGATTLTANNVLLGNGTSALQAVAPGTTGNVLQSNGTTWTSATPVVGGFDTISVITSSSTFTIPTGKTTLKITVVGGGGSGGRFGSGAGGTSSVASGTQTIATISASGGSAGSGISTGAAGGVGSGGTLNLGGGGGGGGGSQAFMSGGIGGGSFLGGNTEGSQATSGLDAVNFGAGGAGGINGSNQGTAGGGGGGCAIKYLTGMTPGNTLSVTIGAGGTTSSGGGWGFAGVVVIEY